MWEEEVSAVGWEGGHSTGCHYGQEVILEGAYGSLCDIVVVNMWWY
jgi:hypothetical protein